MKDTNTLDRLNREANIYSSIHTEHLIPTVVEWSKSECKSIWEYYETNFLWFVKNENFNSSEDIFRSV